MVRVGVGAVVRLNVDIVVDDSAIVIDDVDSFNFDIASACVLFFDNTCILFLFVFDCNFVINIFGAVIFSFAVAAVVVSVCTCDVLFVITFSSDSFVGSIVITVAVVMRAVGKVICCGDGADVVNFSVVD
jgi:hypothetical protein